MLTDEQKAGLKERLVAERERIQGRLDEIATRMAEMSDDNEDEGSIGSEADQATNLTLEATDTALRDELESSLVAVNHALQRMDDGTYGLSEESGQPIPYERLEALPMATRTTDEQARYDAQFDPLGGGDTQY